MPKRELYVELLSHTPDPEAVIAMSAKLCYSGATIDALAEKTYGQNNEAFLQKLTDMGHMSPIEHASFSFGVQGVSRALLAQLTRHRIASFSVQSQRYVDQTKAGINYVMPPAVEALGPEAAQEFERQMDTMREWYEGWLARLGDGGKEDARFVLPNAAETRLTMTMNARELMHFFRIRCCMRAQWEIRAMAWAMLGHCLAVAPSLFGSSGASCIGGPCPEGRMSCGQPFAVREKVAALKAFVEQHKGGADFAVKMSEWAAHGTIDMTDKE